MKPRPNWRSLLDALNERIAHARPHSTNRKPPKCATCLDAGIVHGIVGIDDGIVRSAPLVCDGDGAEPCKSGRQGKAREKGMKADEALRAENASGIDDMIRHVRRRERARLARFAPENAILLTGPDLAAFTAWARWYAMADVEVRPRELLRAIDEADWRAAPTVADIERISGTGEQLAVGVEPTTETATDAWGEIPPDAWWLRD
tara:strand:+ start:54 stop:665 length:612 start_codon:yes stop_codon:yes gene_type:complete